MTNLLKDNRFSIVWTVLRVYLGYQWLTAGLHKLENPAWVKTGMAIQGFWTRAAAVPAEGKPVITYDWYRAFIQGLLDGGHHVWMGKLIAVGEFMIGLALILGVLTTVAVIGGALMNLNFMLAGTASTNPVLYTLAIVLLLAGANAYYWGIDRWMLPRIGFLRKAHVQVPR